MPFPGHFQLLPLFASRRASCRVQPRSQGQTRQYRQTEDALAAGPCCLPLLPVACPWRMSPAFRAMDVEPRAKGVLLEPFIHQVGGHSCVLRFNETTLCKPLVPREHQFYETLPAEMRRFTPQYKGEPPLLVGVASAWRGDVRRGDMRRGDLRGSHTQSLHPSHSPCVFPPPPPPPLGPQPSTSHPQFSSPGVVSVCFDEDEDRNLCLIAYPLKGDHGAVDSVDNSDCEPKSKLLRWTNKKHHVLETEKTPKDWVRQHWKEEKMKSHKLEEEFEWLKKSEVLYYSVEKKGNVSSQLKYYNPWSMKCHQQQLQRMKENAKHRNQYKFILLENLTSRYEVPCVLDLKMGTRQHGDDASEEKAANQIRKCQQSTSAVIGVRLCGMQVYQAGSGQLMFMNKYHGRKLSVQGFKEALFQFFHNGRYLRRELLGPVLKKLAELKAVLERQESYRFYSSSLLIIYDGKERPEVALDSDAEDLEDLSEESADESAGAYAFKPLSTSSVDVRMIDFAHTTCRLYGEDSVVHEGQDAGYIFGLQSLIDIVTEITEESGE
ncbi:inositol hexakisphosphate kinase 2 isoform X1 [Myotis myotis]|uniref:inositol hexakisphosphate kinase 2 isoform X1 n=2 Tax=Myotis myotis TaxID=51298 RepID=UPI00174BFD18|nr:inositol hexakisphosphate kinase 2 isoform X1 [Myotis myotis]